MQLWGRVKQLWSCDRLFLGWAEGKIGRVSEQNCSDSAYGFYPEWESGKDDGAIGFLLAWATVYI